MFGYGLSGADGVHAFDDNVFSWFESRYDFSFGVAMLTEYDAFLLDDAIFDDCDTSIIIEMLDGGLRNHQGDTGGSDREADAGVFAESQGVPICGCIDPDASERLLRQCQFGKETPAR